MKPTDGLTLTYEEIATPVGLKNIAAYTNGVEPSKTYIFSNTQNTPTTFVKDAHQVGLKVHPYTFRPEKNFLPIDFKCSNREAEKCESGFIKEFKNFFKAGVDGIFTDDPSIARKALNLFQNMSIN